MQNLHEVKASNIGIKLQYVDMKNNWKGIVLLFTGWLKKKEQNVIAIQMLGT